MKIVVTYSVPHLAIILRYQNRHGGLKSKPGAPTGDGATLMPLAGSPLQRTLHFSLKGKMCVGFAFLLCIYFQLHLFTYQCLRSPIFGMLFL